MRTRQKNVAEVTVRYALGADSFRFANLQSCGSVWICPVCSAKITERRRAELAEGVKKWQADGGSVVMMTLTAPHSKRQPLPILLTGMTSAFRKMLNRCSWKRIARDIGIAGRVRSLEISHGTHGWHVHFHVLLFISSQVPDLTSLTELLLMQWQSACMSAGLRPPNSHGLVLDHDSGGTAHYVCKSGVESHAKKDRKGRSPFELLKDFGDGDFTAGALFREFAHSVKGLRQLSWSKGLRQRLNLGQERTDKEISDMHKEEDFLQIPVPVWKLIVRMELRLELLAKCRQGKDIALDFLVELWRQEVLNSG